ncbi:MAG: HIT family protein [Natronomonas sp.]|jgi:histidine triad (HIT) family protein|uniref:HIT family protein n=1 Tax=Natronomonas salsuginis TaxID=2217661 RepID=A0A4U5J9Y6_9EURY|nr:MULTISPECIES: HIT family protein [Natronomonas]MDR9381738.1 HIT family protein [Natronomonas sp.]MDR9429485.1 HIT family protein [Natronomonas sp.]TKR25614.1 HIT family protein [Natronomonas salsuginis]
MSDRTIFERIIDGDIPANIVHETERAVAFLDANPLAPGHTLVVPREPHTRLRDAPPEVSESVFEVVRTIAPAVEEAVDADATTVGINDGTAAGQEVPHLHVHVVPRFEGDGGGSIHTVMGSLADLSNQEQAEIGERIAAHIE